MQLLNSFPDHVTFTLCYMYTVKDSKFYVYLLHLNFSVGLIKLYQLLIQTLDRLDAIFNLKQMKMSLCETDLQSSHNIHNPQLSKPFYGFCLLFYFLILRKTFYQLNNRSVVKQQYNPLKTLYFYPSRPHLHSCQK